MKSNVEKLKHQLKNADSELVDKFSDFLEVGTRQYHIQIDTIGSM